MLKRKHKIIRRRDAKYSYYLHGPLARMEADFTKGKLKLQEYADSDDPLAWSMAPSTFVTNAGIQTYNGAIDAAEVGVNLMPFYNAFNKGAGYGKVFGGLWKCRNKNKTGKHVQHGMGEPIAL